MGFDPATHHVVEDSPAGVQAGVAAGMRVLGYAAADADAAALTAAGRRAVPGHGRAADLLGIRSR